CESPGSCSGFFGTLAWKNRPRKQGPRTAVAQHEPNDLVPRQLARRCQSLRQPAEICRGFQWHHRFHKPESIQIDEMRMAATVKKNIRLLQIAVGETFR